MKLYSSAVLNVYQFEENLEGFSTRVFKEYDGDWLDYIVACRRLREHTIYDMLEGGIADDQVYTTVDLYMQGVYTKEQALGQLVYRKPNNQICITSQEWLDKNLRFVESIILK